jgi:hypothetical protein
MNKQTRYLVITLLTGLLFSACQSGTPPTQPALPMPSETPLAGETPALEPSEVLGTPTPTEAPSLAAGTVILDQTSQLDAQQGGRVELSFESNASQVIRLEANLLSGALDYSLHLVDKFGNFIASLEPGISQRVQSINEFTLPYQGSYRVYLIPVDGSGSVQVVVTALGDATGGGLLEGTDSSLEAVMNNEGVYHTYQFRLKAGEVVSIAARADVNGAPDTQLALYGPDGRLVARSDDVSAPADLNAVLGGFIAPLDGLYTAIVSAYAGSTGSYTFSLTSDTVPPQAQGQPDVEYGRYYQAALFEGSSLSVTFDGQLGDVLRISVVDLSAELDVDMRLYSPFGQIIAYATGAGPGQGETLREVQLPYAGRYRLELVPAGSGNATFTITQLTVNELSGGGIFGDQPNGTLTGRFDAPNVFHYYQFNATAGDRITLRVTSTSERGQLDIGFALLGPDGLQAVFVDDSDSDNPLDPSLIRYEAVETGTYTVVVYAFGDASGSYELSYIRE